jgi:hypothetical protein
VEIAHLHAKRECTLCWRTTILLGCGALEASSRSYLAAVNNLSRATIPANESLVGANRLVIETSLRCSSRELQRYCMIAVVYFGPRVFLEECATGIYYRHDEFLVVVVACGVRLCDAGVPSIQTDVTKRAK